MKLHLPHLFLLGLLVLFCQAAIALADDHAGQGSDDDKSGHKNNPPPAVTSAPPPSPQPSPPNPATPPSPPANPVNQAHSGSSNGGGLQQELVPHKLVEGPNDEQDAARAAVASGKAAPLTELLKKLKTDYPGEILDVGLKQIRGQYVFNVKYLDSSGLIKTVSLNAVTLEMQ